MDPEKRGHDHEEENSHLAESTPFLDSQYEESSSGLQSPTQEEIDALADKRAQKFRARVTLLIALLIVAVDLPSVMFNASMVRILESIYCQQYYSAHDPTQIGLDGSVPEELCKVEDVQSQLSSLRGWTGFWSHLPGLFLAVPFGMLADKYGRKWLFVMNILSMQGRTTWQYIVCRLCIQRLYAFSSDTPCRLFSEHLPLEGNLARSCLGLFWRRLNGSHCFDFCHSFGCYADLQHVSRRRLSLKSS